jgi:hypothetical protein
MFVLQHKLTHQIYTCMLINIYQLQYYGIKFWNDEQTSMEQFESFLNSQSIIDPENWIIIQLDENRMKMGNVKLKNNSQNLLFLNENNQFEIKSTS